MPLEQSDIFTIASAVHRQGPEIFSSVIDAIRDFTDLGVDLTIDGLQCLPVS